MEKLELKNILRKLKKKKEKNQLTKNIEESLKQINCDIEKVESHLEDMQNQINEVKFILSDVGIRAHDSQDRAYDIKYILENVQKLITNSTDVNNLIHVKIENLEFHANQRILELRARQKIQQGKKLKVFFVMPYASKFGLGSVYRAMESSKYFEPYVFVVHARDDAFERLPEYKGETRETYDVFVREGYRTILGYNEEMKPIGLEMFSPDIIFLSYPNLFVGSFYKNININYNYLTCYVSYGISVVNNFPYHFENYHVNTSWKVFSETKYSYMQGVGKASHNGINYILSGYPKLDSYKNRNSIIKGARKKIIIAPHWSIKTNEDDQNMAVFHLYNKFFVDMLEKNPEMDFYFKPHPDLRYRLQKLQRIKVDVGMTPSDYDSYLENWSKHSNGFVVGDGDYMNLFIESDCLITDCGSFIAEYLPTENPCIYMLNPERKDATNLKAHFNSFGINILNTYYLCHSWEEVVDYYNSVVIQGLDFKKKERKKLIDTEYVNLGNSGEFIVDYIIRQLVD